MNLRDSFLCRKLAYWSNWMYRDLNWHMWSRAESVATSNNCEPDAAWRNTCLLARNVGRHPLWGPLLLAAASPMQHLHFLSYWILDVCLEIKLLPGTVQPICCTNMVASRSQFLSSQFKIVSISPRIISPVFLWIQETSSQELMQHPPWETWLQRWFMVWWTSCEWSIQWY